MKRILITLALILLLGSSVFASSGTYDDCVSQIVELFSSALGNNISVAFVGVDCDSDSFNERLISDVEEGLINNDCLVVNRRNIDKIIAEMEFQTSGLVDDDYAVSIGHMVGAQMIITGSAINQVKSYRLELSLIDVESAQTKRQINFDISYDQNLRNIIKGDSRNIGNQRFSVGAKVGLSIQMNKAHEDMVGTKVRPTESSPTSFMPTFVFAFRVFDTLGIQLEVSYIKDNGIDVDDYYDEDVGETVDIDLRYSTLEIPLIISWNFIQSPVSVDVYAGGYLSLPVSTANMNFHFNSSDFDAGGAMDVVGIGYGVLAGFDVGFELGPGVFVVDGRFCYDIGAMKASGELIGNENGLIYRRYVGISVGYSFEI